MHPMVVRNRGCGHEDRWDGGGVNKFVHRVFGRFFGLCDTFHVLMEVLSVLLLVTIGHCHRKCSVFRLPGVAVSPDGHADP